MNFSYMKKVSKLLSLILVLVLMSTLFAGCWKKDTTPEDTSGPGLNLNLSDTTPSSDTQTQPTETEPVTNENMATVLSQINVRTSPSMDASISGTLYAGDRVEITMRETVVGHEWGRITSPVTGWIVMEYVEMDNPSSSTGSNKDAPEETTAPTTPASTEPNSDNVSIKGVITANGLNIRSEASSDGKIQGAYNKGDVVTILETKNGWGRTSKGWIKMDYVDTTGSTTTNTGNNTNNNTTTGSTTSSVTGNGSTTVQLRGIVIAKELNIRASASQDSDRLGSYTYGNRVEIYEKSGSWGRTNKGWISLNYVYQDGTTGTNTAKGTVTAAGGLNIRSGPGTGYASVGSYAEGDTVNILEQFTYDGVTWGCTSKGWISMKYVDVGGSGSTNNSGSTDTSSNDDEVTGTITANGGLRIRSGPGSDYGVVGSLKYGDKVTIQRRETVDGTTWGRIDQGWISMAYVDVD